jgi:sterol desaturase/sphingolipid hydroxylase (fatty acid hydroxylase superfamily)
VNWIDLKGVLFVMLVFVPLERVRALRPEQRVFRRGWLTDVTHLLVSGAMVKLGLLAFLMVVALAAERITPSSWRATIVGQPLWVQFPLLLILADLGFYMAHRAFHTVPILWRFHAVHHSIQEMDWLAGHRVHPIDQSLTKGLSLVPVYALGFSMPAVLLFAVLYQWQSLLIHSNVRIGFGPLKWILASPRFHHWHHANCREAVNKNFAGQLVFLDILFGTLYMPPGRMPERYGIEEPVPRSYLGQIVYPFIRRGALRTQQGGAERVLDAGRAGASFEAKPAATQTP